MPETDAGVVVDAPAMDAPRSDAPSCGIDEDGDGAFSSACGGTDCDDHDPMRAPGRTEICDAANVDEDCDPSTHGMRDVDGDGFVSSVCCNTGADGSLDCEDDCNDANDAVRPTAPDVCNELDDDCDGAVDEGVTVSLYVDGDRDLHGDGAMSTMGCAGTRGYASIGDDCDDGTRAVYPGQFEICDGVDNDCDGSVDDATVDVPWYLDTDADGFGDPSSDTMVSCTPIAGRSFLPFDCDDTSPLRSPAADERCNARDDDCDGSANFSIGINDFEDDDGDRVADLGCGGTDCDDRDPEIRPGASERCNGRDDDCDGRLDEACGTPVDAGVDAATDSSVHFMDVGLLVDAYVGVDAYAPDAGPIDAWQPDAPPCVPTGPEICNGLDDDCNGKPDEFVCVPCPSGYSGVDGNCTDIDECALDTDGCDPIATCMNAPAGSFTCVCPTDYEVGTPRTHCAWANAYVLTSAIVTVEGERHTIEPYGPAVEAARTATTASFDVVMGPGFVGTLSINGTSLTPGTPVSLPLVAGMNTFSIDILTEAGYPASYPLVVTRAVTWAEIAALHGANTEMGHQFGSQIAADGDTVVVSAPNEQGGSAGVNGPYTVSGGHAGAAYVFERRATGWVQTAYLKPANPVNAAFAETVAISGDIIAVGTSSDQTGGQGVGADPFLVVNTSDRFIGSVTTYYRGASGWVYDTYIKASNAGNGDSFGIAIALSGDTLVVGATGEDSIGTGVNPATQSDNSRSNTGAAYVFVRSPGAAGTWSQQAYLKASNPDPGDDFGWSVALSGNTLLVGAWNEASSIGGINTAGAQANNSLLAAGAVYVFTRSGTTWSQQAYVKSPTPTSNAVFGSVMAVDADVMMIGEPGATVSGLAAAGQVLVYTRTGVVWTLAQTLTRPTPLAGYRYGGAVAVRGGLALVGAPSDDSAQTRASITVPSDTGFADSGAVYVYQRPSTTFVLDAFVKNVVNQGGFGSRLAIATGGQGPYFVVGASGHYLHHFGGGGDYGGVFYVFR